MTIVYDLSVISLSVTMVLFKGIFSIILRIYSPAYQISQEFQMMEPLSNNFIETFKKWAPHKLSYASKVKPDVLESLTVQFQDTPSKGKFT